MNVSENAGCTKRIQGLVGASKRMASLLLMPEARLCSQRLTFASATLYVGILTTSNTCVSAAIFGWT